MINFSPPERLFIEVMSMARQDKWLSLTQALKIAFVLMIHPSPQNRIHDMLTERIIEDSMTVLAALPFVAELISMQPDPEGEKWIRQYRINIHNRPKEIEDIYRSLNSRLQSELSMPIPEHVLFMAIQEFCYSPGYEKERLFISNPILGILKVDREMARISYNAYFDQNIEFAENVMDQRQILKGFRDA